MEEGAGHSYVIGIDLGTTYSCVGVFRDSTVEIIANQETGNRTTASYVAFTHAGRMIGDGAKSQAPTNATNTVFDAKRMIGRRFDDVSLQNDLKHFAFHVVNEGGKPKVEVDYKGENKRFTPEEISAMILEQMKEIAEAYLGTKVKDAVITVPAYFNDSQRQATKDAGAIAGLNVLRIINEPTAAAIAYGLDKKSEGERNVLIFDLGGGTFDVSILTIADGVFEVRATSGDTHLGGEDFDNKLVNYFIEDCFKKNAVDISQNKTALRFLRSQCEDAKRKLSFENQANIIVANTFGGVVINTTLTRAKFEDLCSDLFKSTLAPVKKALKDAEMKKSDIHDIVLVGGSTRIPKIQKLLQEFFDGKQLNKSINPDEAVAYGASVQAAILNGDQSETLDDVVLLDVTPLSLGVGTAGGQITKMIERNTTIPTKETKIFGTNFDNQTTVKIRVFEGERALAKDNNLLGEFLLGPIPPAPMKLTKIEVTFEIDANGILHASAMDVQNPKMQKQITITNDKGRLSKEDIDRMIRDAELNREEDDKLRARASIKTGLDEYITQIKSTLREETIRTSISTGDKQTIESTIEEIIKWVGNNPEAGANEIERKRKDLENVCTPIISQIYKKARDGLAGFIPGNATNSSGNSTTKSRSGPTIQEIESDEDD